MCLRRKFLVGLRSLLVRIPLPGGRRRFLSGIVWVGHEPPLGFRWVEQRYDTGWIGARSTYSRDLHGIGDYLPFVLNRLSNPDPENSMERSGLFSLTLAVLLGACFGDAGGPSMDEPPSGPPQASEIILQAVDAGTGTALADEGMTVRHLVRFPITLDESAVEAVPASEPYHIRHTVAWDSLVVEVRLEASSYHRLDTVLTVARGETTSPITLRMARRLTAAAGQPERRSELPSSGGGPPSTSPASTPDSDAGLDRTPLRAGDQAFAREDWVAAIQAYRDMPEPPTQTGTYAREYSRGLVRMGEAHMRRGELAGALDALERATEFPGAGYESYLLLGQAQCTVGRFDQGRESVRQIERMAPDIPASEWGTARALAAYQRAHCTYQQFQRVEEPLDILRVGGEAIGQYEDFIEEGEALNPLPSPVSDALDEARIHIEEIRERMRRGR